MKFAMVILEPDERAAGQSVGGFILLDVATAAEALDIACSLPAGDGARIELRPVVETPPAVEA